MNGAPHHGGSINTPLAIVESYVFIPTCYLQGFFVSIWEQKRNMPKYVLYKAAIEKALNKVGKYYRKMDNKPVYVLTLGVF